MTNPEARHLALALQRVLRSLRHSHLYGQAAPVGFVAGNMLVIKTDVLLTVLTRAALDETVS